MASPTKMLTRSPLKETDANMKQQNALQSSKKRLLEHTLLNEDIHYANNNNKNVHQLDQQHVNDQQQPSLKKRPKIERDRSIEGAVLVSKNAALKNIEPKVTPKELLEWQSNWKKIMKRDSKIYFDITEEVETTKVQKRALDKRQELLKRGFLSLGARITLFFDNSVTIVITRRSIDTIHLQNENDILKRAKKSYMKVWGYEKAIRFLSNLDVDLNDIMKLKTPTVATPTLSNLLQNEKLYGPNDRDPRTKRDDTHYFKYPHMYMYDLWQIWSPIITLEWKPQELSNKNELPYPILKIGSFGRCPFVGDRNCDETSYRRVVKRYNRDKANKRFAMKLRQLYQRHAEPYRITQEELIFIPHDCDDSKQSYERWQETKRLLTIEENDSANIEPENVYPVEKENSINSAAVLNETNVTNISESNNRVVPALSAAGNYNASLQINKNANPIASNKFVVYKGPPTPQLKRPVLASFTRQDTEDLFHDDLCSSKRQSRANYEIKASGVHQSNDVATSFGNGLGPTKASVMSKNIKTLSRLVVDRKLGTSKVRKSNSITNTHMNSLGSHNDDNRRTNESLVEITNTVFKDITSINQKETELNSKVNETALNTNSVNHIAKESSKLTAPIRPLKNSGYCENCRVKYASLDQHILSEKHMSFADNILNFEAIDSLIDILKFQF